MTTRVYAGAAQALAGAETSGSGGIFRCLIGEDRWQRLGGGLPDDVEVRAIALHPGDSQVIYAGTQHGPYRSTDGGEHWTALGLPDAGMTVWSLLFHPRDASALYAGTAPAAVYKSGDGGDTWRRLPALSAPGRVTMSFPTRVTRLAADPSHPRELYAGLEVDGVQRSLDGGESWEDMSRDLVKLAERPHLKSRIVSDTDIEGMMDAHALCVSSARPGTVFLALRMGLFRSADRGTTWEDMEIGRFSPLTYARDVQVSTHDARTLYACLSPAARRAAGRSSGPRMAAGAGTNTSCPMGSPTSTRSPAAERTPSFPWSGRGSGKEVSQCRGRHDVMSGVNHIPRILRTADVRISAVSTEGAAA